MVANPDLDPQNLPPGPSGLKLEFKNCQNLTLQRIVHICVTVPVQDAYGIINT